MEFEQTSEEKDLETFLTGVALTSESSEEEEIDKVSLMTIHQLHLDLSKSCQKNV